MNKIINISKKLLKVPVILGKLLAVTSVVIFNLSSQDERILRYRRYLAATRQLVGDKFKAFRLLPDYIFDMINQLFRRLPKRAKEVVFTFEDDRIFRDDDGSGRYAYLIMNAFSDAGYNVYFLKSKSFSTYIYLRNYGRFIYQIPNVKFISSIPSVTDHMVYIFDTVHKEILDRPWKKISYVNIMKPNWCRLGELMPIPYFMHPYMYLLNQPKKINKLRNSKRSLRIFFGGNTKKYYNSPLIKRYAGQIPRAEGMKVALDAGDNVMIVREKSELKEIVKTKTYLNECRMVQTDSNIQVLLDRWLDTIAKSDFFLCLVGTDVLMCHNVIEAMAVGSIPIISYPDWFFPPLEHKKNAILYLGREDLVAKLKEVFAMDQQEIDRLRQGVFEYYQEHLGNINFIKKYEATKNKIDSIILYAPLIGTDAENQAARETLNTLKEYFGNLAGTPAFNVVEKAAEFIRESEMVPTNRISKIDVIEKPGESIENVS